MKPKFRVRDTVLNCWLEDFAIGKDGDVLTYEWHNDYAKSFWYPFLEKPDRFVVQQFTGLKDKNGREICEGDVVAFKNSPISSLRRSSPLIVENRGRNLYCLIEELEVIGNIFETLKTLNA